MPETRTEKKQCIGSMIFFLIYSGPIELDTSETKFHLVEMRDNFCRHGVASLEFI